ncbi:5'/3'-nucleotidase SurE [Raineyella sp. W15-4]|uniref:5'/3'-nucleotidase SurE n=1 Tax=Raineyella sp. W15-4 TaxID=3081651 RepID=UPI002953D0B0|nr:5'/3'-nucleotidase SurE [Raineyella sp. W15-4]WOQ16695.1 5'/3'-nucleotidase SurE [Raineyella sp. W15-4]
MQILITNDDGIDAPGLAAMARAAARRGHTVLVAAPDHPSSGVSAALGMRTPTESIVIQEEHPDGMPPGVRCLVAEATPAQIVYLAVQGEYGEVPRMVLSGINSGANTGRAILHSGTVGAALTAAVLGIRAMAVSLAGHAPRHWDAAEEITLRLMEWLEFQACDGRVLNLNIPDVPLDRLRGLRAAPLAAFGELQASDIAFPTVGKPDLRRAAVTYEPALARDEPGSDHYLLSRDWATMTMVRSLIDDFSGVTLPSLDQLDPAHAPDRRRTAASHAPSTPWSD